MKADLAEKTFEPVGNLVFLQMVPMDKSPGGVLMPDSVKGRADMIGLEPAKGWVVSAGCQCRYAKRGDLVMVQGTIVHLSFKGIKLAMVMETQIISIIQDWYGTIPEFKVTDWKAQIVERTE